MSDKSKMAGGSLSSEERRKIGLRFGHLGLHVPGEVLRLDLYRLVCYFHASEYFASLDQDAFDPLPCLRDQFQDSEVIRILLQTAVAIRFIGLGHADEFRGERELLEEPVGLLFKNIGNSVSEALPLREACNKIIHARNITPDSNKFRIPSERFLKPRIFCYDDFQQKKGWKARIDLFPFVEACEALAIQFS